MLTETFITVNGKMTKLTVSEFTITLMVLNTKVGGSRTSNTEKEKKSGPTTHVMKDNTKMVRNMDMVNSFGLTDLLTQAISSIITYMAQAFTLGLMVVNSTVNGITIKCMVTEFSHGTTEGSMKENTSMIKNRAKVFSLGQMDANMTVNGRMENNMELVSTSLAKAK